MGYPTHQTTPTVIYITTANVAPATHPHPQPYPPPPPIMQQGNSRWRNKPQSDAIAACGVIFMSAGMNLALGVGWSDFSYYGEMLDHFRSSWFIGLIIGTIFSMPLRHLISKRLIMAISSLLIIIGGITFTCEPYYGDALLTARYINGIAVGLVIVPFLMYASEIADDSYRGSCLATEQYSISCGIAIQIIYSSSWSFNVDFAANRLHGIFDIIFGFLAAVSLRYFIESPVDCIRRGNDAAALESLARLQRPAGITTETYALLEKRKMYVREEENLSIMTNVSHGFLPLLKMIFFRSTMLAFCFSLPLNMAFQYSMYAHQAPWAPLVAACGRILGSVISLLLVDKMGRKLPSLLAMALIGGLSLGHAYLFHSLYDQWNIATAKSVYITIQLVVGFFTPYASVYIGEAFPLKLKPVLMDICIIVEQLLHIIFIATMQPHLNDTLSAQGGIIVGAFVILCFCMPETRNTTLSEAQRRFRQLLYLKFK